MNITLRQLQIFSAVSEHLSITQAAEKLHLTQPAVSMQLKQLESVLDSKLFELLGKRLHLTEAGELFRQHAQTVLEQLTEAKHSLDQLKGLERGHLRLAVVSTVNYYLPKLLATFCRRYPGIRIELSVSNREGVLQQLNDNKVDLALMGQPPAQLQVDAEPFMANPLVIIAPPNHPLKDQKNLTLEQLTREPWVSREPASGTRRALERYCAQVDIELSYQLEMSSDEALKQSVSAGLGLGFISLHTLELELAANRLIQLDVEDFPIQRQWYAVHLKGKHTSVTAEAFLKHLLNPESS